MLAVVAATSVAACVALMAVRVVSAVSFQEPMHLITSCWEQESLFAIWKSLEGLAVYADPYRIPFAASVYNWLFYETFAGVTGAALNLFALEDAWIPTVARLFTLAGAVAGIAICYRSFVAVVGSADRPLRALSAVFAVFVFFGPLVGFWAITARPDIWALALEVLGVLLFWRFHRSRSVPALLAAAAALYAAWAFKQANVLVAISIALFMLTRCDWKAFGLFAAALGLGWGVTVVVGSPEYAASLLEATRKGFSLAQMTRNIANFSVKSAPPLAAFAGLLGALLVSPRLKHAFRDDDRWTFAVVGVGATAVLTVAASAKIGASEVYYLALSYFLALGVLVGTSILRAEVAKGARPRALRAVLCASAIGWGANLVAVATVFLGFQGVLSVAPQDARYLEVRRCIAALPKPVFVDELYLSLPWMNAGGGHFVVSYNYETDRRAGIAFERGGIGTMIEGGEFAALVLRDGDGSPDGGRLDRYESRPDPCGPFVAYRRRKVVIHSRGIAPARTRARLPRGYHSVGGRARVRAGADQTDNALAGACDPLGCPIGHVRPRDVAFDGSAASDYERRNRVRTLDVTERKPYRSVPEPSEREPMTSANQACWAALVRRERDRDAYWSQRDPICRDRLAWQAQSFRHLTHLLPGEAIVELGAGRGWITRALVQVSRGLNPITAVTFDAEMAPLAAESPVVERILWSEPSGALAGRRFRYAVVQNLLDRDNAPQLLRMVFELLEDGGECVFFESNPWNPVFALRDALKRLFARPRAQHLLSRRELEPLVSEAGFADVLARFADFVYAPLTPRLVWLLRNLSILLENAPGVRVLAGRILVHARKPSGDAPRDQVPLVRHDNLRGAVSVVVPCHDEEMNVRALADGLRAHFGDYVCQIVLVDDNSTDSTRAAIEALAADDARIVPVIRTPPSGVGRALADGFRAASGRYILSMDCDFQHLLPELEDMFDAAAAGADAVFGSRFSRHSVLIDYPFTKILANRAFHVIVNGLFRLRRRDLTNNLKLVRTDIVKRLHLSETGFAANAEIGVEIALSGCALQEVPVSWINRDRDMGRSSFSLWRSGGGYMRVLGRVALATRFGSRPWVGRDGEA